MGLCPQDLGRSTQLFNMAKSSKMMLAGAAALAVYKLGQQAFVPAPAGRTAPLAAGAAAMLGAAPAYADKIDDAAKKLSEASYPFLKEIDWTSDVYGKLPTASPALGHMDGKLVTSLADYTAINGAIGHMVASAG